jgi:hypothetical protein
LEIERLDGVIDEKQNVEKELEKRGRKDLQYLLSINTSPHTGLRKKRERENYWVKKVGKQDMKVIRGPKGRKRKMPKFQIRVKIATEPVD